MLNRRKLLKMAGLSGFAAAIPNIAFSKADGEARYILIILRGAVDGLALLAPYGDGNYQRTRGELAIPAPGNEDGLLKLDGMSGMQKKTKRNSRAEAKATAQAAARFLRTPDGPKIAVIEIGGWDTHANQGAASGGLANKFAAPLKNAILS